ncbi:MAG: hypothetical protein RXR74_01675, partial [Nitrososphaeria archaeon]
MRRGPSLRRRVGEGDWMDIEGAIGGNKYWNVAEGRRDYVYALALSRARAPAPGGRYVRATGLGRVIAPEPAARFCRKYRVLLVDSGSLTVVSVLTWRAFREAMANPDGILSALESGSLPRYINYRTVLRI